MKKTKFNTLWGLIFIVLGALIFPVNASANWQHIDFNAPIPFVPKVGSANSGGNFDVWHWGNEWQFDLASGETYRIDNYTAGGSDGVMTFLDTNPPLIQSVSIPQTVRDYISGGGTWDNIEIRIKSTLADASYLFEEAHYRVIGNTVEIRYKPYFRVHNTDVFEPVGVNMDVTVPLGRAPFSENLVAIFPRPGNPGGFTNLNSLGGIGYARTTGTMPVTQNHVINCDGDLISGTYRYYDNSGNVGTFSGEHARVGRGNLCGGGAIGLRFNFHFEVEFYLGQPLVCPRNELENVSTARPLLPDCCFPDADYEWSALQQWNLLNPILGGRDVAAFDEYNEMYRELCVPLADPIACEYRPQTFCPDCDEPGENNGMARDITDWDCIFASNKAPLPPSPFNQFFQEVYIPNNPIFSNLALNPYCDVYCREEVEFVFPDQSVRVDAGFHFVLGDSPAPANVPRWGGIGFEGEVQCQVAKIQESEQLGDYNDNLHINHPQFVQDWTQANYDVAIAWDDWQKFELEEWAKDSAQYIGPRADCQYFFSNSGSDQNNSRSRALGCIEEILMWQCNSGDRAADGSGDTERTSQFTCRNIRSGQPYYNPCNDGYSKSSIYDRTCRSSDCPDPCRPRCDRCTCTRTVTNDDGTTSEQSYRCTSCRQCGTTCRGVTCSHSAPLAGYDCNNLPGYSKLTSDPFDRDCYRDYTSTRNYWQCLAYDYTRFQKVMTPEFQYNDPNVNDSSGQFEWCAIHRDIVPYLWNDRYGSGGAHHREISSSYLSTITSGGVTGVYRQPAGSTANRTPANRTTAYWRNIYNAAVTRRTTAENFLNECQEFEFNYAHLEPRLQLHYNDYKYKGTFPLVATSTTDDQLTYFIAGTDIGSSGRLENIDSARENFVNPVVRNGDYYERFRCEDRTSPMTPAIWPRVETVVTGEKCVEIEQPYWVNDNFDYYIQKEIRYNLDADTYRYVVKDADNAENSVSLHTPPSGNYTNIGYSNLPVHYIQDPAERMDQLEVMIEFVSPASLAPAGMTHKFDDYVFENGDCTSYTCYIDVIYTLIAELDTLIIFRQVDLENPFVGKSGTGREPGYNWRESASEEFIRNNRGVETYDVYSLDPMYEITLTPMNIAAIKNYNRRTTFADFNLTCTEGSNDGFDRKCISDFLIEFNVSKPSGCSKNNWDC